LKITFLGTGTSHGVPMIGCNCTTCTSTDLKDKRLRSSVLLEKNGKSIVIDTGPEFRIQAIRAHITHLDAILYTHPHADHLNGIDDVRPLTRDILPLYGNSQTIDQINTRFNYAVNNEDKYGALPHLSTNVLKPYEKVNIAGFAITPIVLIHGNIQDFGYRIDNIAYLTDCNKIPNDSYGYLKNLDLVVIDALQHHNHRTHFNIFQAIEEAKKIGAKRTLFTHISHGLKNDRDSKILPKGMEFAYDTLCIEI
jgi:phosphoribosyl 1,2-cyclic phosphate phosphodiesterase